MISALRDVANKCGLDHGGDGALNFVSCKGYFSCERHPPGPERPGLATPGSDPVAFLLDPTGYLEVIPNRNPEPR
jgi:hypothetical protein